MALYLMKALLLKQNKFWSVPVPVFHIGSISVEVCVSAQQVSISILANTVCSEASQQGLAGLIEKKTRIYIRVMEVKVLVIFCICHVKWIAAGALTSA